MPSLKEGGQNLSGHDLSCMLEGFPAAQFVDSQHPNLFADEGLFGSIFLDWAKSVKLAMDSLIEGQNLGVHISRPINSGGKFSKKLSIFVVLMTVRSNLLPTCRAAGGGEML